MPFIKSGYKTETISAVIKWDASYSVGITEFDQQHRMLILMINELNDSVTQDKGRKALGTILDGLASYANAHFANEERLFDKYAYPWSVTHTADHRAFAQKVSAFIQEYKLGNSDLSSHILGFLSDWLKNHIIGKDKTYSYFFITKGLN